MRRRRRWKGSGGKGSRGGGKVEEDGVTRRSGEVQKARSRPRKRRVAEARVVGASQMASLYNSSFITHTSLA